MKHPKRTWTVWRRLLLAGLGAVAAPCFAVELNYECVGLWQTPIAIIKAVSTMKGSFDPSASDFIAEITLETGGKLSGRFSGTGPYVSNGTFTLDGGTLSYTGTLTRISTIGGHGGFRFDSPQILALFSCDLN